MIFTIAVDALTYASWLFVVSLGLTLVFGVLKILNIAHGSVYALGAYAAAGRDVRLGTRLPALFAEAGIGAPDETDVAGRLGTMADSAGMLAATYRSIAPVAIAHGLITEDDRDTWLSEISAAERAYPSNSAIWPLLVGALKRKR